MSHAAAHPKPATAGYPGHLLRSARYHASWQAAEVTGFTHENLSGARFEDVCLTGAGFHRPG